MGSRRVQRTSDGEAGGKGTTSISGYKQKLQGEGWAFDSYLATNAIDAYLLRWANGLVRDEEAERRAADDEERRAAEKEHVERKAAMWKSG